MGVERCAKLKGNQQTTSSVSMIPVHANIGESDRVNASLYLHNPIGNQSVSPTPAYFAHDFSQLPLHSPKRNPIQPKLKIGSSNDRYEKEADRVADQVMQMPEPQYQNSGMREEAEEEHQTKTLTADLGMVQRQEDMYEEEEGAVQPVSVLSQEIEETIQAKRRVSGGFPIIPNVERRISAMSGGGQPLTNHVRTFFEPRFNRDFSKVRVHSDTRAAGLSCALNAQAFTHKQDIFFGSGRYTPETGEGKRLLAHELTHVVQQNNASKKRKLLIEQPVNEYKQEVDEISRVIIQRQPEKGNEWERKAKKLNELRKSGPMTPELSEDFLKLINEATSPRLLVVEKLPNGALMNLQDSHIYFDEGYLTSTAKTQMICRYPGRKENRFKDECRPSDIDGFAIIMGPKVLMETRSYILSVIRHEYAHVQQQHKARAGISLSEADAEVEAYSEQLYYIYELSDSELQGTITAYLSYYINASSSAKRKANRLITKYMKAQPGHGRRTAAQVEDTLKKEGITSTWRIPHDKRPIAENCLNAMIKEIRSVGRKLGHSK